MRSAGIGAAGVVTSPGAGTHAASGQGGGGTSSMASGLPSHAGTQAGSGVGGGGSGGIQAGSTTPAAMQAGGGGSSQAGSSGAAGGKLSFAADVYEQVISKHCSTCHSDAPSFGGLALFSGAMMAYSSLVEVPAGAADGNLCRASGLKRVAPGDPEHSLLYLKLTNPPCGSKMPPMMFGEVTEPELNIVRQWIMDGAAP